MISVVLITKDEEKMLKGCLESVKWADEVVIVDNGSTDKTLEIAKNYTDKIFNSAELDYAWLRNLGMEKSKGDWVLYVDADERILSELKMELIDLVNQTDCSAFALSRRNIIFGTEVSYGPFKKDWMIKLLKRADFETWVGKVHEYAKFKGKVGYSQNSLLHLTHRGIDQIVAKSLIWSKIDAKLRLEAHHPKMSSWRFFRILITELFYQGVIRRGFFAGTIGVMDSILQTFSLLITYVRLWELQQPKNLEEIYQEIDRKLIENNFKF